MIYINPNDKLTRKDIERLGKDLPSSDRKKLKDLFGEEYREPFKYSSTVSWRKVKKAFDEAGFQYKYMANRFAKKYRDTKEPEEKKKPLIQRALDNPFGMGAEPERRSAVIFAAAADVRRQSKVDKYGEKAVEKMEEQEQRRKNIQYSTMHSKEKDSFHNITGEQAYKHSGGAAGTPPTVHGAKQPIEPPSGFNIPFSRN